MTTQGGKAPLRLAEKLALAGLDRTEPALIGVSGGKDSTALLHLLAAGGFTSLIICHLDHALRPESVEEARFVETLAEKYQAAFVGERQDVGALARKQQLSIETAARAARHDFFGKTAATHGTRRLFLAHHADDQVETYLLNLFRGAGGQGLRGMQERTELQMSGIQMELIRPMLGIWRRELDSFAAECGLEYREDASNALLDHTRNRVRHELVPRLRDIFGREVQRPVLRAAAIQSEEDAVMRSIAEQAGQLVRDPSTPPKLLVAALREQPIAIQRRVVYSWLLECGIDGPDFADVEAVRGLALSVSPSKMNLPKDRHVRRRNGQIFLE